MIAKLEFNLPEDREEFKAASDGIAWALLVWELLYDRSSPLREEGATEVAEAISDFIIDYMADNGLVFPS